jgi:membrane protease YdiL (CAAX protease family)
MAAGRTRWIAARDGRGRLDILVELRYHAGPMLIPNLIRRPFSYVFTDPWARIDANDRSDRVGKVSARTATLVTCLTATLMLVLLRFVVMDQAFQGIAAQAIIDAGYTIWVPLGERLEPYHRLLLSLSWVAGSFTCYFVVPALVVKFVFGLKLTDFYLTPRQYWKKLPFYALLFLPVGLAVLMVAQSPNFQAHYPFYDHADGWQDQVVWELGYAVQFFALEFFFRGFMLRGVVAEMGSMGVMVMMIPYCMIHFGKPLPECLGSILSGLVLGTLAMDTKSIWGGVTIHVAVAWLMDGAALYLKAHAG